MNKEIPCSFEYLKILCEERQRCVEQLTELDHSIKSRTEELAKLNRKHLETETSIAVSQAKILEQARLLLASKS